MRMNNLLHLAVACAIAFSIPPMRVNAQPPEAEISKDKMAWVEKCLADFQTIKVGMTRSQLEAQFPTDGGLSSPSYNRFTHPACPYFKVDVTFAVKRDAADRAITEKDDKVTQVSKPYLEAPMVD